jgi:sulfate adenylyltransferase large subunit
VAASAVLQDSPFSINDFLAEERGKDLLRFSTAGSVDDGKSTLIGRLLYDTQSVYDDQVRSIEGKGTTAPGQIDFALLTDGLRAEREQGITIDVAYRYFSTARRKFIIADTPGHEQYTRNMATGASTADAAVVLIDARKGVLPQSRRHAYITSLLGVRNILVAVNKMDLVGYDEQTFRAIERDFHDLLKQISTHTGNPVEAVFVPVSALLGDNVVHRSEAMGWYAGPSLLELLETLPSASDTRDAPFRFSVQRVLRPDSEFRGFAGQISSGTIHPGDRITVLPSGLTAYVTRIVTFNGDLERAHAPLSVTVTLDREVDVSRGDLLVSESAPATATRRFKAALVWMDQSSLERGRRYLLKHMSLTVPAHIAALEYRNNIRTLEHEAADSLSVNEIGVATLQLARPVPLDRYAENRSTGAFILIDPETNGTVAAGMVTEVQADEGDAEGVALSSGPVTAQERAAQWGHLGGVLELHGPAELLDRIERSLFVAKAVTIRCSSEQEAQFAATSGFIALLAKPSEEGLLTAQAGGEKIQVDGGDPDQAVATVLRLLHRVAILSARGTSGVQ